MVSVMLGALMIPKIILIAFRRQLFDEVNERKIHRGAVPRLGGISFFPGYLFSVALVVALNLRFGGEVMAEAVESNIVQVYFLFCAIIILYLVGIADDLVGVRYKAKFVVQIVAAALIVGGGMSITDFYGILWLHELPVAGSMGLIQGGDVLPQVAAEILRSFQIKADREEGCVLIQREQPQVLQVGHVGRDLHAFRTLRAEPNAALVQLQRHGNSTSSGILGDTTSHLPRRYCRRSRWLRADIARISSDRESSSGEQRQYHRGSQDPRYRSTDFRFQVHVPSPSMCSMCSVFAVLQILLCFSDHIYPLNRLCPRSFRHFTVRKKGAIRS